VEIDVLDAMFASLWEQASFRIGGGHVGFSNIENLAQFDDS